MDYYKEEIVIDKYVIATGAIGDTVYGVYAEDCGDDSDSFLGEDLRANRTIQIVPKSFIKYSSDNYLEVWDMYNKKYRRR